MALDLKCRACSSDNTQKISLLRGQQSFTGVAGQTALAASLQPPKSPKAFLSGFLFGALAWKLVLEVHFPMAELFGPMCFVAIFLGVGMYRTSQHEKVLAAWNVFAESHFLCLRCGATFQP
jgi:hypothetical protein